MKKLILSVLALSLIIFACKQGKESDHAMVMDSVSVGDTTSVVIEEPFQHGAEFGMSMDSVSATIASDTGLFEFPAEPKK